MNWKIILLIGGTVWISSEMYKKYYQKTLPIGLESKSFYLELMRKAEPNPFGDPSTNISTLWTVFEDASLISTPE